MFNTWNQGVKGLENYGILAPHGKSLTDTVFIPDSM